MFTDQRGEQRQPFIAAGGPGALVVWVDDSRPGLAVSERPVTFARLDAAGTLIDPLPVPITPPAADTAPSQPMAVWNGNRALVVWDMPVGNTPGLRASRVTSDGMVLDPGTVDLPGGNGIALDAYGDVPVAVVPSGSDFLVFWRQESNARRMGRVGRGRLGPHAGRDPGPVSG